MSKKNYVYEKITNEIIKKLEEGTIPWKQPFKNGLPTRWKPNEQYRGINLLLLPSGEYASKKQILEAGGRIKKEEMKNAYISVYWHWWKVKEKGEIDETEENEENVKKFAKPFYYKVWEINTQCTGLESKRKDKTYNHSPIEQAEEIIENYFNPPSVSFNSGSAWYKPFEDHVNVPPKEDFKNIHEYYSTLYHELIHSTGHKSRLDREGVTAHNGFGTELYSKEELIAELGASMLCGVTGIDNETIDNSASYIQSWLRALKNDKTLIVSASQKAQKASDYIQGIKFNQ
ncbi:ArdC family protein [Virgibacillus salexigens]|uniref:ArdC family protein n=1 Tax=Virgibacillus massiliensis TaxID=1462526 RepID=UPI00136B880E|nr:zincin-like metallopeptidase domain-containing protein [Virgibacillus massiliensis]MYL43925.1 DUF1738 domain-containing protein [Virgibacillus massiliensis]